MSPGKEKKEPWLKFYPSDWRGDPRLRMCSIGARGLWMEMMCIMHEADPYGHLIIGHVPVTNRQLASLAGIPLGECLKFVAELESSGVYSRQDGTKIIYSRRMVRDKAKAEQDRKNGKGGGNPKLTGEVKEGVNPTDMPGDKAQRLEVRGKKDSEADASGAEAPIDHRKRLFTEGLKKLAGLTGKGPDACRSFVGKCLKAASDDAIIVLGLIEDAERNQVANATAWIAARLKPTDNFNGNHAFAHRANQASGPAQARDTAIITGMDRAVASFRAARNPDDAGRQELREERGFGAAGGADAERGAAGGNDGACGELALLPAANAR